MLIYLVTDYKGNFGSKYKDNPYRSGFNKILLSKLFKNFGYDVIYFSPSSVNVDFSKLKGSFLLYSSLEDEGLYYKSYIEDFIYAAELSGAIVIPNYVFLKAHENKVFFEQIKSLVYSRFDKLNSWWFGAYEELRDASEIFEYPVVLKKHRGAMSRGVYLAGNRSEALCIARKIMSTPSIFQRLKDVGRGYKHNGYQRDSWHRNKIIVQQFIPNLLNDWKILIYGNKYYVLTRQTKAGDFRASGQGLLSYSKNLPAGLLDFAKNVIELFNVPQISIDVAYDGTNFYLLESQFVFFGSYTIEFAEFFYSYNNSKWEIIEKTSTLEEEYVLSMVDYIKKNHFKQD